MDIKMRPRAVLIIIGILIMVLSLIPILSRVDVSISGFNIAERVQESRMPQNTTPYLIAIFILALIAVVFGIKSRKIIMH